MSTILAIFFFSFHSIFYFATIAAFFLFRGFSAVIFDFCSRPIVFPVRDRSPSLIEHAFERGEMPERIKPFQHFVRDFVH
ncbi:MAG: hypothetical protein SO532_00110, partial [Candidatus Borkfalkiaceae bacterium]|nr:hypothetical protein [Christensenellaceae bacterium]